MKFHIFNKIIITLTTLTIVYGQISPLPRYLGEVKLNYAAYIEVFEDHPEAVEYEDRFTLYVSTFNPINFSRDFKYYLNAPGRYLKNISAWDLKEVDRTAFWPNSPDYMPEEVAGKRGVVWTSGFLVPGKTRGQLELYDTTSNVPSEPINIASADSQQYWSYHRVLWKDMDEDGDLDALTSRFHKPIFGQTRTELLYLENPGVPFNEMDKNAGWKQHILTDGADVHFRNFKISADGIEYDAIVAAEFFNEQLVLYYTLNGNWSDTGNLKKIPIDITLGQTFDVYVEDFNQDGKLDILVTAYNYTLGNVFLYEIPDDFRSKPFIKHTIADGFKANGIVGGQSMTPGSPKPFYPSKAYESEILPDGRKHKPFIMLSGDDDGKHYILQPASEIPTNVTYIKHILIDTEKTTSGKFAIGDYNNDGYTEIIAVGYSSNTLYTFTYAPPEQQI